VLEFATDEELNIIGELCCEDAHMSCGDWWWSRRWEEQRIVSQLEAISLRELRELAALLGAPTGLTSHNPLMAA
jgi:hypothetical protein